MITGNTEKSAEAMQILVNEAMLIERTRYLSVLPYERSELRQPVTFFYLN